MAQPIYPNQTQDLSGSENPQRPALAPPGVPYASESQPAPRPQLVDTPRAADRRRGGPRVGKAIGSAAHAVRHLPDRLLHMKERFAVLRGRARETAGETAGNLKRQAECTAAQARTRASKLAQEHPLEAIAVLGGAAFVLGFALRMWRDRRG